MKQLARIAGLATVAALFLVGCGDETTNVVGLRTVASLEEAGKCDVGDMVFNLEDSQVYVCGANDEWGVLKGEKGEKGDDGSNGRDGAPGDKGDAGASCTATPVDGGFRLVCGGETVGTIKNGQDGAPGEPGQDGANGDDGTSCTGRAIDGGVEISCGGQVVGAIMNGQDGAPGADGSNGDAGASCSAAPVAGGFELTCGGQVVGTILNGQDGAPGADGSDGDDGASCTGRTIDGVGIEISCGGVVVDTVRNGRDGAPGESCTLASIEVNGVHGVEISCGTQKDTVMNGAQGIQGVQGNPGQDGAPGASCSGVSLGDTAVIISCGGVVVDTLTSGHDGAQGEQGIQGVQGEAGQSCTGRGLGILGVEISCGGVVVDTLRHGGVDVDTLVFCGTAPYDTATRFCDVRDSNVYKWVRIGTQTWMAENLNYEYRRNGSTYDNWCNGDCAKYGRHYTWIAAMGPDAADCGYGAACGAGDGRIVGVCPDGWHLPAIAEWNALFSAVGSQAVAGTALKASSGWDDGGNGSDAYGFTALAAGDRFPDGEFDYEGAYAHFWSSAEDGAYGAYAMGLYYLDAGATLGSNDKDLGLSVRCVKN